MKHGKWLLVISIALIMVLPATTIMFVPAHHSIGMVNGASTTNGTRFSSFIDQVTGSSYTAPSTQDKVPAAAHYLAPLNGLAGYGNNVVFHESGLPTNSSWYVTINGVNYAGSNSTISLQLSNGTYSYTAGTPLPYLSLSNGGTFTLPQTNLDISFSFISKLNVNKTLFLSNGTTIKGNFAGTVNDSAPVGIAIDPLNNYSYVADSSRNSVDVISTIGQLIKTIPVGTSPSQVIFDPVNGYIYVTNSGSNNLSVIGQDNKVTGNIPVGNFPFGITFDSSNNNLYVTNLFSNNVSVISTPLTNNPGSVVSTIALQSSVMPFSSVYDNATGSVYVSNLNGSNLVSLKGNKVTGSLSVAGSPSMMVYDSLNGNVYVTDSQTSASTGYGHLSVIDPSGRVVSNLTIPGSVNPFGIAFDPHRNLVYIADSNSNLLISYNPLNGQFIDRVTVGSQPIEVASGLGGNLLEVSDFGSGSVSFISYTGAVQSIVFNEGGLPINTTWSVKLNSVTRSGISGSPIIFNETPGQYSYKAILENGYKLVNGTGNISVSSSSIGIEISYLKLYSVTVNETGLNNGTQWNLNISGQNYSLDGTSLTVLLPNGTYFLKAGTPFNATTNGMISFNVSGSNRTVTVHFHRTYAFIVTETGLLPGTAWKIYINGNLYNVSGSRLALMVENGTYQYNTSSVGGYSLASGTGVAVVNGKVTLIRVNFTELFTVTFMETGLMPYTSWGVTLNGSKMASSSTEVVFTVANGTYGYSADLPGMYSGKDRNGSVTVSGSNVTVGILYTKLYNVTFTESGLSNPAPWWISLDNKSEMNPNGAVIMQLPNGTYSYRSYSNTGYERINGNGTLSVNGSPVTVRINYMRIYDVNFIESGLPNGTLWTVIFNGNIHTSGNSSILLSDLNGSYDFRIQGIYGYSQNVSNGQVILNGSNATVHVGFSRNVGEVNFHAVHLPEGAILNLTFNGTSYTMEGSSLSLNVTYGNYSYIASYYLFGQTHSISGHVNIRSANTTVNIQFPSLYHITFRETGLKHGGKWSVNLSGYNITTENSTITFYVGNGTYNFSISDSTGQPYYVKMKFGGYQGRDYAASSKTSVSPSDMFYGQVLDVMGGNISMHVIFNNSNHDKHTHHDHGKHWYHDFNAVGSYFYKFLVFTENIVQYAVTNITVSIKLDYFFGSALMFHMLSSW